MYLRLLFSSLKSNRLSLNRKFRKNTHLYNDVKDVKQIKEVKKDEPIKYSTSEAAKWKAIYSTSGKEYYEMPRIQSPVVMFSLVSFMIYFFILREENDLDDWLREAEKTMPLQIEEAVLRGEIETNKRKGFDVSHLESKLEKVKNTREKMMNTQ